MLEYMEKIRTLVLKYPDMVVLVPSNDLNPEPQLYFDDSNMAKKEERVICPERSLDEVNQMIEQHIPKTIEAREMLEFLS
jgi:hypothetical protein